MLGSLDCTYLRLMMIYKALEAEIHVYEIGTSSSVEQFAIFTTPFTLEVLTSALIRASGQAGCMCRFLCLQFHETKALRKALTHSFALWDPSPLFSFCLTQDKSRK